LRFKIYKYPIMKTIEITTSQKVTIQYELATIGNRFIAFFIDSMIMLAYFIFISIFMGVNRGSGDSDAVFLLMAVFFAPLALYSLISEIFLDGQSIGKRSVGIKIVKLNGDSPHAYDYFIRWVFRLLDIWISIGSVATLVMSASSNSQRIGDILAGTTVIKKTSARSFALADILKISSIENYTITYNQVTKLSEKDMLFVKLVLERERRYPNDAHKNVIIKLSKHLADILNIGAIPKDKRQFLRTLLNDYIVLTR
jgi:uncharacterized RDD family membrane protein YckC